MPADTAFTFQVGSRSVEIIWPDKPTGRTLLCLPGWNLPATDWRTKTKLVEEAGRLGYTVVLPEMGKSVYARQVYPETRAEWRGEACLPWLADTLITILSLDHGLFSHSMKHAVVGLSTGGRGALLLAAERPDLFAVCAALSGDFLPQLIPQDNLMRGWYGPMDQFPERWKGEEHPPGRLGRLCCRLLVAHGKQDQVVPVEQSEAILQQLKRRPYLEVESWLPDSAAHDYAFWSSCTPRIVALLEKLASEIILSAPSHGQRGTVPDPNP